MNNVHNISYTRLLFAYLYLVAVITIVLIIKLKRTKDILIAALRMSVQLFIMGYALGYIIDNPNPFITIAVLLVMEFFAIFTIFRRFKGKMSKKLKLIIAIAMMTGSLTAIFYFVLVVVGIPVWFDPQYVIPLAGMLVGNSMTGISLGIKVLVEQMNERREEIEEKLILGATPKTAIKEILLKAFDSAIMPTINSMLGMGIIFLPGMMTGQILSGTNPSNAIMYQIAIMLGILASVSICVMITLEFGYRTYFNKNIQFIQQKSGK
ncbi:iron export ABC transporter permease subunit FetB [Mycoplasma sp. ES3157-GEN-MYC]|uniref:ABC transporter permease n=1 Tax=Mycoplasma miroungigenitalium TaxID=754515 RepID=UPI001C11669C|nr:iron export ABC transporter permease subunit FetB [Mycoplasma miroungigenitalium]MBU4690192.1 iron export ABC transporter permease subunit FetB [Mycoplasma miroungigenitalium]